MAESIFEALFFGQPKSIANSSRNNIANANNLNSNDNIQFGINWCESDYKKTKYIAEFYNTFTNIVYVYFFLDLPRGNVRGVEHQRHALTTNF